MSENHKPGNYGEYSLETRVGILTTRVDNVSDILNDLKSSIKKIEDIVGMIRLIELQSTQQGRDFEKTSESLKHFNDSMLTIETEFENRLDDLSSRLSSIKAELTTAINGVNSSLLEKINIGKGIKIGLSLTMGVILAGLTWYVKDRNDKIDQMYEHYIIQKAKDK